MNDDVQRIEQYLRGITVPEHRSDRHRQQLRRQIVEAAASQRTVPLAGRGWKIAAAAAAMVGIASVIGLLGEMQHRFAGRTPDGVYHLIGTDTKCPPATSISDANDAAATGPAAGELAEVLRQRNAVKLVRVIESEVNGRFDSRTLVHRYTLPEGRTTTKEGDANSKQEITPTSLSLGDWTEIGQLRQAGKGENLGLQEVKVEGRMFTFQRERYTLHNGTKVIVSVGEPKDAQPAHD